MSEAELFLKKEALIKNIKDANISLETIQEIEEILGIRANTSGEVAEVLKRHDTGSEKVEVLPFLKRYHEMYTRWSEEDKKRASWKFVQERLLNKDYIEKSLTLHKGGVLFGLDEAGNPLVADGGVKGIMHCRNYADTRKAVMGEENNPTGYVLFPYKGSYKKSEEIIAFERFTGEPFVRVEHTNHQWYQHLNRLPSSAWLESGENPENHGLVRVAISDPNWYEGVRVFTDKATIAFDNRGVRRLLRIEA